MTGIVCYEIRYFYNRQIDLLTQIISYNVICLLHYMDLNKPVPNDRFFICTLEQVILDALDYLRFTLI